MGKRRKSSKNSEVQPSTETSSTFGFHLRGLNSTKWARVCATSAHVLASGVATPAIGPTRLCSWRIEQGRIQQLIRCATDA